MHCGKVGLLDSGFDGGCFYKAQYFVSSRQVNVVWLSSSSLVLLWPDGLIDASDLSKPGHKQKLSQNLCVSDLAASQSLSFFVSKYFSYCCAPSLDLFQLERMIRFVPMAIYKLTSHKKNLWSRPGTLRNLFHIFTLVYTWNENKIRPDFIELVPKRNKSVIFIY